MWDVGRHPDDRSWHCANLRSADGQEECPIEHQHDGVKWGRVLTEFLPRVECEQREIPACRSRQYAAGDPLLGRCHEGLNQQSLAWRN
jgi:hypothetical protein